MPILTLSMLVATTVQADDWELSASWYPLLRLEWPAAVSPKGHGTAAELLPRQEFTFSAGFRF